MIWKKEKRFCLKSCWGPGSGSVCVKGAESSQMCGNDCY